MGTRFGARASGRCFNFRINIYKDFYEKFTTGISYSLKISI